MGIVSIYANLRDLVQLMHAHPSGANKRFYPTIPCLYRFLVKVWKDFHKLTNDTRLSASNNSCEITNALQYSWVSAKNSEWG